MSGITFPSHLVDGFGMRVTQTGDRVDVLCSGTLESADPVRVLQPALLQFHADLVGGKVALVHLEMQSVDYMNSAGIKCFMAWFLKAEQNPGHYTIEVVYEPAVTWQQLSFTTMGRLAPKALKMLPLKSAAR
ncbi:MAG TPA: hypothetical protein VK447_03170 [Myxococcaceae bacterium]|nr:hypothetical protein [Myxococcaceae bacterium]